MAARNKDEFTIFLKSYDKVRKILKDMYVFGCYNNLDYYNKLGISKSAYEKEIFRLNFYIDEDNRNRINDGHYKIHSFSYDRFKNDCNYFVNSYKLATCTAQYLVLYVYILCSLRDKNALSLVEIADIIANKNITLNEYDTKEIGRKINDMIDNGTVIKDEQNRSRVFKLAENPLEKLNESELVKLYYIAELYSNKTAFNVPAIFLKEKIKKYLKSEKNYKLNKESVFIYEYNFLHTIFNDIIINELVTAIYNKNKVEIKLYNKGVQCVYPVKIVSEYMYGRQYVLCADNKNNPVVLRIDRIKSAKVLNNGTPSTINVKNILSDFEKSWCISQGKPQLVEIDFYYNDSEAYILEIVRQEKQWGTITILDKTEDNKNHFLFSIEVNDYHEMKPWIRRFGSYARVRKSNYNKLAEELVEEWKELLYKYNGAVSEEK